LKITQSRVTACRVIPHPIVKFSNIRPALELTATLSPKDEADYEKKIKLLQDEAERLLREHIIETFSVNPDVENSDLSVIR